MKKDLMQETALETKPKTKMALAVTPMEMISQAVSQGWDIDRMKQLMDLQERWDKNEAFKKYTKAFSAAQAKIESVAKSKLNPQTKSKYAELASIIETTKPIYTTEGFSIIFYEGESPKENYTRICADVVHEAGHKESYHYDVPLDGVGIKGNANMTAIHGKASSTTYGRRYLMCMIWNIATNDDTDGSIETYKMTEECLMDWLSCVDGSQTIDDLKKNFKDAYNAAKKLEDGNALLHIIKANDAKLKALTVKT